MLKRIAILVAVLLASLEASAQYVQVKTKLFDGSGNVVLGAYLHFQLMNCGVNFPSLAGSGIVVKTTFDLKQALSDGTIAGQVIGNDQVLCGGVASTFYHITPMRDPQNPLAPGQDYVVCSALASPSCYPGAGFWDASIAQPMSSTPASPGFQVLYANPTLNQIWNQPLGTSALFFGVFDFRNATVLGLGSGGSGSVQASGCGGALAYYVNPTALLNGDCNTNLDANGNLRLVSVTTTDATHAGAYAMVEGPTPVLPAHSFQWAGSASVVAGGIQFKTPGTLPLANQALCATGIVGQVVTGGWCNTGGSSLPLLIPTAAQTPPGGANATLGPSTNGNNPEVFVQNGDATYDTWVGVDTFCDNTFGPPCRVGGANSEGTPTFYKRTYFNDTLTSPPSFKNSFIAINHQTGIGTVLANQDRAFSVEVHNPVGDTGTHYSWEAIQAQATINGTPVFSAHPDTEISVFSGQLSDLHVGTPTLPNNGINVGRFDIFRQDTVGLWGSCSTCWAGLRVRALNLSTVSGGSENMSAIVAMADDLTGAPSAIIGNAVEIATPFTHAFSTNRGLYLSGAGPTTGSNNYAIRSDWTLPSLLTGPLDFAAAVATYEISGPELSTPANPAAGIAKGYFKSGGKFCAVNSAGTETCTGGTGIADPGGNGLVVRTALNTTTNRSLATADSTHVTVANADGTAGNPTVDIGTAVALLASPAFTGTPTVPTAAAGTSTTQAASTAFVASALALLGVQVNAQSGNYTLNTSPDRAAYLKFSGGTTATLTLCQIASTCANNFPFVLQNLNSGNLTVAANAADKIDNSATGGSITVLPNFAAFIYQDSSSAPGNWWSIQIPNSAIAVTLAGSQTLTNKTLTSPIISTISNTGTVTIPTSTDTLVGKATTDTLTNKTLVSGSSSNNVIKICQQNQQGAVTLSVTAGTFTTLASCSIPANTLSTNNTGVHAKAIFHIATNGAAINYQWKFGATATASMADSNTTTVQDNTEAWVFENGSNTQQLSSGNLWHGGTTTAAAATAAPAETTSGGITLLIQASCNAACASAPTVQPDLFFVEMIQ